jgi:hypothetical protein
MARVAKRQASKRSGLKMEANRQPSAFKAGLKDGAQTRSKKRLPRVRETEETAVGVLVSE